MSEQPVVATTLVLRGWQERALSLWSESRRGVASVVTGAGKTVFALACIARHWQDRPRTKVLVVVPTVALQDQWLAEFQSALGLGRDEIALHGGGGYSADRSARVHVSVVNSARKLTADLTKSGEWMLVADECHRYGAPANRRAIQGTWEAALGLSATPSRQYDTWFEDFVVPETGGIFFEYGYEQALKDGVLAPLRLNNYEVPLTPREASRVEAADRRIAQLIGRGLTQDDDVLKRALLARARVLQSAKARLPAARTLMQSRHGTRAIVFHEQIAAASELCDMLVEDGHRAVAYHSGLSAPTRQRNLLLFRLGQMDVLVTCRALDEGLDVPDAEFGLICASTASTRQRIQRLGRLVRRFPGKDAAEIATIFAGDTERRRLESEEIGLLGVAGVRWYEVRFA